MIAVIASALQALGVISDPLESDSHAARTAAHAEHVAALAAKVEARKQAASSALQLTLAEERQAEIMAAEKVAATRKRLAREIAKDLRAGIAPLFAPGESAGKLVPFTVEPSRSTALAIASVIREANDRAVEQLGATLWDRAVALALLEPFLTDHPHLMMYEAAKQVELGHAVLHACIQPGPVNVPSLIDALLHAEKMITLAVAGARHVPDDNAKTAWALALEHADRSDHFRAHSGENAAKHLLALQTAPQIVMASTRHGQVVIGRPQDSSADSLI